MQVSQKHHDEQKKKKKRPDTNERIRTHTDDSTNMMWDKIKKKGGGQTGLPFPQIRTVFYGNKNTSI